MSPLTTQQLQADQERLQTLLNLVFTHAPIILWVLDKQGVYTLCEGKGLVELGMDPGMMLGRSVFDVCKDYPQIIHCTQRALANEAVTSVLSVKDHIFHTHYQPLTDADGKVTGLVGVAYDISDVQNTLSQMHILSSALEQTADLVMITNRDGVIEYVNPAFEQVTGYFRHEILQKTPAMLDSGKHDRSFFKNLWDTILGGDPFSEVFINKRKDGTLFFEEKTITPIRNTRGEIAQFVATGKDVSDRMRTQERMQFMAHHDALTKLPNRALFMDRLRQAMARSQWHKRLVAVIMLDLDRFQDFNLQHGQQIGDQVLQQLSRRFTDNVRSGDTVARMGSDEFAILLEDMTSEKDVSQLTKKLLDTFVPPVVISSREFTLTASIGVSLFPNDGEDAETLLRYADVALYRAKSMGRNTYHFYSTEMSARAFERLSLENSLRQALTRQEFFLQYQPQVDIRSNTIVGVEALLRWQHPELGVITPTDFIPLLEETGLVIPVGAWALRQACLQARQWQQTGFTKVTMSVNLSGRQFNNPDFFTNIHAIIADTGINPAQLELELTESMLMRNASKTISALHTLHHLGVSIAVDDFGTGYSSLNYLRRFPISTLKIDRSFIRDVADDADDAAIATAIIVMGHSLNLRVIAEGVENEAQRELLRSRGCYLMQGNLLGTAMPAEALTKILQSS